MLRAGLVLLLALAASTGYGLNNGLGRRPQMGYNTWNRFHCSINETLIRQTADALVASGLRDAGYVYLNIDDCWAKSRNSSGYIVPDPKAFPSGMRALADYVHGEGLKFGIYSDAGKQTCAGRPGSYGFEKEDAASYAEWQVDYLKYDNCNAPSVAPPQRYARMRDALNGTGRPIFYSLCDWGVDDPWVWGPHTGNSWRTTQDIADHYGSFLINLLSTAPLARFAGPGGWNDPDMLEVGNGGMSEAAYRSHFALWAAMKAPLLAGCDVRHMDAATRGILLAPEVIEVNQDEMGVAGDWVVGANDTDQAKVMAGPLHDGARVAVFFNMQQANHTGSAPTNVTVDFHKHLGFPTGTKATVRDLYARKDLGSATDSLTATVAPEDCAALRITPVSREVRRLALGWRPWHWRGESGAM